MQFIICKSENHTESMVILTTHFFQSSAIKQVIKSEYKEMTSQHLWEIRNLVVQRAAKKDFFEVLTSAEKRLRIKDSWLIQYALLPICGLI